LVEKEKISYTQFIILIIMFILGTANLITPSLIVSQAKQDAWLSILFGIGIALLLAWLYSTLAERYKNMTIIEYSQRILGKWLGWSLSFLYCLYFLILTAGLLHIVGDFITTHVLTETPFIAIQITFIMIIIFAVRLGLETFARTFEMLFPYVILFFIVLMLCLIPQIKLENVLPVLEHGVNPVLRGTIRLLGVPYLDVVIFLMIAPNVNHPKKVRKSLVIAILIGGIILLLVTLLSILVLGSGLTSVFYYPTYDLAQRIDIGHFIKRIEIFSGGIIFLTAFAKITISFYALVVSLAQTFSLKNYQFLTLPIGMITVSLSLIMFPNIVFFNLFMMKPWTPFMLIFGLLFPLILLTVDLIKGIFLKNTKPRGR